MKHILEYNKFNELNINNYRNKIDFSRSLLIINTFKEIIDLSSIKNRRFMYNPKTGTLILGDENKNVENSSHDSEFHYTNIKEKYDDFVRGWIGFNNREFKNGIIQFYGSINNYDNIFDTIQMFAYMDGIKPKTKIIGTTQSTYTQSNYTFIEDYLPDTYKNNFKLFKESINDILEAPNGQKSNLTEKQWHQVRTPEFKAWFGDWENDPKNASKVLDENGEPLVVYHGSNHKFIKFNKSTQIDGFHGKGFYFTTKDYYAKEAYGKHVYNVYLNCKNSFIINEYYPLNIVKYILGDDYKKYKKMIKDELEYSYHNKIGGFIIYPLISNNILIERGYDGLKHSDIYIMFNPNQIKSATDNNGEFDPNNENITK